jgi:hypothetical protein
MVEVEEVVGCDVVPPTTFTGTVAVVGAATAGGS